ncbi:MAG: PAS domain-containing protein, partial [Acidobacteriota bacterium]
PSWPRRTGMLLVDHRATIRGVDPEAVALLGREEKELVGRAVFEVLEADQLVHAFDEQRHAVAWTPGLLLGPAEIGVFVRWHRVRLDAGAQPSVTLMLQERGSDAVAAA